MNFRLLLLLLALLLASCASGPAVGTASGRSASTSSGSSEAAAGSNGYCMPRKHACEKYEKEKRKKNPQQAKIERYYRECVEHNRHCR
jgi:hypothetical protein